MSDSPPALSRRERQIMDVLFARGKATAAEIVGHPMDVGDVVMGKLALDATTDTDDGTVATAELLLPRFTVVVPVIPVTETVPVAAEPAAISAGDTETAETTGTNSSDAARRPSGLTERNPNVRCMVSRLRWLLELRLYVVCGRTFELSRRSRRP